MLSKETLEKVLAAFDRNDAEAVTDSFAENGEWDVVGQPRLSGRENIRKFFQEHPGVEMLDATKDHMIINGNTAVVDGQGKCKEPDGKITEMFYCDVYDFEGDKVKSLRSYCIPKAT